jgi:glycosyltransferase involved in cell wall biosynthesis
MAAPEVSVIIPAYNCAGYISESVRSILGQTFSNFELIVVNDCSTDHTCEVIRSFADSRIIVHDNIVNLGAPMSYNTGVAMARGRFVARLDADDIAEPERLAVQYDFMAANRNVTVCGSDMTVFGAVNHNTDVPEKDGDIKAYFLAAAGNIMSPTTFIRRQFLIDHNVRAHPSHSPADDLGMWVDSMKFGAVFANVKQRLVHYRVHGGNLSMGGKTRLAHIRADLAAHFFPALTHEEVAALLRVFSGKPVTISQACQTVAACEKALTEQRSFFGENRTTLRSLIESRLQPLLKAVRRAFGDDGIA